jgi:hypothetical protein
MRQLGIWQVIERHVQIEQAYAVEQAAGCVHQHFGWWAGTGRGQHASQAG